MNRSEKISNWIKQKVEAAGAKGCILGLSGGIDSAVVALLCKKVFPQNTLALILPCHSLAVDIDHAKEFAQRIDLKIKEIDLSTSFDSLFGVFEGKPYSGQKDLSIANIKPRLRMTTLYYFASQLNYLVIGTGNRSELEMGYFTKYGDGGVDLLPLGNLLKKDVRALAQELGVTKEIIDKAPSAGLWAGQTDESEMGITYDELDQFLSGNDKGIAKDKIELIRKRQAASEHKRTLPEIFGLQ
ncbi:MAG: NAD(+) synthase [bacterium]